MNNQEFIEVEAESGLCEDESILKENLVDIEKEKDTKRWQPVIDAWNIKGVNTNYHKEMQKQLMLKWPTLYKAIYYAIKPLHHHIEKNECTRCGLPTSDCYKECKDV